MAYTIGFGVYEYNFKPGLIMGGYMARPGTSEGTHDPICCRVLLIQTTLQKVLFISADFIGLSKKRVENLKNYLSSKYNLNPDLILISIIHSHSSVLNINLFTSPSPGVVEIVDEGIREAVDIAFTHTFQGQIEIFKGEIEKVSFNRRDWDPLSEIINTETIILKITDDVGGLKGLVYNYSCHPVVMGAENLLLSADWPYYTQEYLRNQSQNQKLFVMFLQGTPGNLNPRNVPLGKSFPPNSFKDCQEIGEDVAKQLLKILSNAGSHLITDSIKGITEIIQLPLDDEDKSDFFGEFAELIETKEGPMINTIIQAIRIGNLEIVGLPGEIFSEIGLNLKKVNTNPDIKFIMVIGYTNDYIGYVGPRNVYQKGGYEMMMMSMSEEEGPILESASQNLIKKL